jgi:hypothetical protein
LEAAGLASLNVLQIPIGKVRAALDDGALAFGMCRSGHQEE